MEKNLNRINYQPELVACACSDSNNNMQIHNQNTNVKGNPKYLHLINDLFKWRK